MLPFVGEESAYAPLAFAGLLLVSQLALALLVLVPALLSEEPLAQRLALGGGRLAGWTLPVLLLATWGAQLLGTTVIRLFEDVPTVIEAIFQAFAGASPLLRALLILELSLLPALVEEALFRGYVQERLARRWPSWLAVVVAAALFAVAHGDPIHAAAVLPLGIWLGVVARRARSVRPAVLCHAFNNLTSGVLLLVAVGSGVDLADAEAQEPGWPLAACCLAAGFLFLVPGVLALRFGLRPALEESRQSYDGPR